MHSICINARVKAEYYRQMIQVELPRSTAPKTRALDTVQIGYDQIGAEAVLVLTATGNSVLRRLDRTFSRYGHCAKTEITFLAGDKNPAYKAASSILMDKSPVCTQTLHSTDTLHEIKSPVQLTSWHVKGFL
jgi:hypothetical protein